MSGQGCPATRTLAGLYFDQGYYPKAAAVYRTLLAKDPQSRDLAEALFRVETMIDRLGGELSSDMDTRKKELGVLAERWAGLVLATRNLQTLNELRADFERGSPRDEDG